VSQNKYLSSYFKNLKDNNVLESCWDYSYSSKTLSYFIRPQNLLKISGNLSLYS